MNWLQNIKLRSSEEQIEIEGEGCMLQSSIYSLGICTVFVQYLYRLPDLHSVYTGGSGGDPSLGHWDKQL